MSAPEAEDDGIPEGADLCLCCLEPVRPGASLCGGCGAPQDFLASTLPFLRVLSEGFLYRRAVQAPRSLLSVAGIWVIFGQMAAGGLATLWYWFPQVVEYPSLEMIALGFPALPLMVFGVTGLAASTLNYVAYRRSLRRSG